MRRLSRTGIGLVVALAIAGCSTSKNSPPASADLTGSWQLTMPNGNQVIVKIIGEGHEHFRILKGGTAVNGSYERRGKKLVMVAPDGPGLTEFVWKIDNGNHLTLVKEPDVSKTHAHYRAATLQRYTR